MNWKQQLEVIFARNPEALRWFLKQKSFEIAWKLCPYGDWMESILHTCLPNNPLGKAIWKDYLDAVTDGRIGTKRKFTYPDDRATKAGIIRKYHSIPPKFPEDDRP